MTTIILKGGPAKGYRDVMIACNVLEEKHPGLTITKMQRLLLMERGTVEGLLSVIEGFLTCSVGGVERGRQLRIP